MNIVSAPKKIIFNKHGSSDIGFLTALEQEDLHFSVHRVFWTYFTPQSVVRGRHAHKKTTVIIVAVTGKIIVTTETLDGKKRTFVLDKPNVGLLVPPLIWHTQRYSHTAIQLVLASRPFNEKEYIRDYKIFKKKSKNA